jgi:HK97 family phage prohead protease
MSIERRFLSTTTASLRAESQGDEMALVGYAARFGTKSHPLPQGFTEQLAPGCFKRSIADGSDVVATFNHSADHVLGRTKSGTLRLAEDDKGLKFRCQLDKNQTAHRDLHSAIKRGDIADCSFAFTVPDGGDDFGEGTDENGQRCILRTVRNVKLIDVSVVTHPAYGGTSVDARAAATAISPEREDQLNRARLALVALDIRLSEVRQGGGFEAGAPSPRYEQGQANDPTCSLRDDDDPDPDFTCDDDDCQDKDHERAAATHRNLARKAENWQRCAAQHKSADRHDARRQENLSQGERKK